MGDSCKADMNIMAIHVCKSACDMMSMSATVQSDSRVRISLLIMVMIWFTPSRQGRRRPKMMPGRYVIRWKHRSELASNGSAGNLVVYC